MANTYTSLHYHLIFSTKHREPWIREEVQDRLWAYLAGIARQNRMMPLLVGGIENHVHALVGMSPVLALSDALRLLKGGSSIWVRENLPGCRGFAWQDGYAAFTVSKSQIPEVKDYIQGQREHHRVKSFQEEYRAFLDRHEVRYEEKYLWD